MATVYLIHFDKPLHHARHYLGFASGESAEARFARHKAGAGARILQVCNERNIDCAIVRTWDCATAGAARELEHRLKSWHGSADLCPVCNHKLQSCLYVQPICVQSEIPF